MKIVDEAMRKYFESLVVYRVASLVSSLTALQVRLLGERDTMDARRMDAELDRLLNLRKVLDRKL
jgi:hypothetical protein